MRDITSRNWRKIQFYERIQIHENKKDFVGIRLGVVRLADDIL